MTKTRSILLLVTLVMAFASLACRESTSPEPAAATETTEAATAKTSDAPQEVVYEPAYPEEVSTEDLTDDDAAQQESSHSQGDGEEHTHGEDQGNDDDGQNH